MGRRTCALYKGEIYSWIDLLRKFKIKHQKGISAHAEWDTAYSISNRLPEVKVLYWDEIENETSSFTKKLKKSNKKNSSPIPKAIRDAVWMRDVGNSKSGKCYVCERIITDDLYETGHIISRYHEGSDDFNNLRVVCVQCNKAMGTRNLEEYKKEYHTKSVHRLNLHDVTKENVIEFFEQHKFDDNCGKFYEKAIELLNEC